MKNFIIIFCLLFAVQIFAIDMIADITEPVQTEFGTYTPYPVTIVPQILESDPGADLENVVNLERFTFSENALNLLRQNRFVVSSEKMRHGWDSATGFNEMFDVYNYARENSIPIFVTTDAMLHSFHLCFDYILKTCEEERFIGDLNLLLDSLLVKTEKQYKEAAEETIKQVAMTNLNFLIVAKKLLDSTYVEPINGGPYLEELENIRQTAGFKPSPIFGYEEDYTQYIPRGHYTRSDELKAYFRSMMWLGRMTFSCEDTQSEFSRKATRSALLLVQAMANVRVNNKSAISVWDDIYQPTVFFVGKSDDIGFYPYNIFAAEVYGKSYSILGPDIFADETKLTAFLEKTKALEPAAITYPGQPAKGFRFMGQRFIPDSWVLDELVELKTAGRSMPTGLDVMIVLGSKHAYSHLSDADKNNPSYQTNLGKLINIFQEYPDTTWAQNAYWNWLYSLMPLLSPKGTGYPCFMQTTAWQDKDLFAALASWAELRHDTILYAKQSGTETGMKPGAVEIQGYVEPNPHFYGRLAALSNFMIEGLKNRDLLFPSFQSSLEQMNELSLKLKDISEKELTNVSLSYADYQIIFAIGKTLYSIVTFEKYAYDGPLPEEYNDDLEPMPVIADVHTDANSGMVLEEGVGYPYQIYVVCSIEGRPTLTMGAGFSYFEFTWPMNDRLTDEKWREMLVGNEQPQPPEWANSFIDFTGEMSIDPDFYAWAKPVDFNIAVEFNKEFSVGDTVTFKVVPHYNNAGTSPAATVTFADGSITNQIEWFSMSSQWGGWLGTFPTKNRPAGKTYIDIQAEIEGQTVNYRAGMDLQNPTGIITRTQQAVENFRLQQNYPNPFNPETSIRFAIPTDEYVTLAIYNLNGRLVKYVVNSNLQAGSYSVAWDGTDNHGLKMSSGIYYYKLTAGNFLDVKRMLLLR